MTQEQLEKLIDSAVKQPHETETIEFKVNNNDEKVIGKIISALANSANLHNAKRAFLIYGIEDKSHNILGTSFQPNSQKIGNDLLTFWLARHLNPSIDFRIHEFKYKDKNLVVFEIPPAINQPIKFEKTAYIRIGEATPNLTDYPEKESKIWNNIHKKSFETGLAKENLTAAETLELLDYAKYFSLTKQPLPTTTKQFLEKMGQHNLVKQNYDNCYDITNLGAILFANDLGKFKSVERKAVRVIIYQKDTRENILKQQDGILGYAVSFERLIDYINDRLPSNEEISKALRKEVKTYPSVAIREFVANALIHQDLTISGAGPLIEIFNNRIEITNTGEPLIETERFIDHPPRSRNEALASFMRQVGICEEGGTGVDRALINIAIYKLPAPSFEKYENFTKITLYAQKSLKDMSLSDKVRACFQHCVLKYIEKSKMTNATLRERLGIQESNYPAASAIIKATIEQKLIKESEKTKEYIPFWA